MFRRSIIYSSLALSFLFSLTIQAMDTPVSKIKLIPNEGEGYRILLSNWLYDHKTNIDKYEITFSKFFDACKETESKELIIPYFGRLTAKEFITTIISQLDPFITNYPQFTTKVTVITNDPAVLGELNEALKNYTNVDRIETKQGDITQILESLNQTENGKAIILSPGAGRLRNLIMNKHALLQNPTPKTILINSMTLKEIAKHLAVEGTHESKLPRISIHKEGIKIINSKQLREALILSLADFFDGNYYIIPLKKYKHFLTLIGCPETINHFPLEFPMHSFLVLCTPDLSPEQKLDALYGERPMPDPKDADQDFLPIFSRAFNNPISQKPYKRPMKAPSGYTYDEASYPWIQKYHADPLTGAPLKLEDLEFHADLAEAMHWIGMKNFNYEWETLKKLAVKYHANPNNDYCLKEYISAQRLRFAHLFEISEGHDKNMYKGVLDDLSPPVHSTQSPTRP